MMKFTYDPRLSRDPPPNAFDFLETRFFRNHGSRSSTQLPEPAIVRAQRPGTTSGKVVFKELGLFVKYGQDHKVSIEEAQTMQAIQRAFPDNEVPIPEVVAWRRSDGVNFIYMSLVHGVTLEDVWSTLTEQEKSTISTQLRNAINSLRSIEQHPLPPFIGSISRTKVRDIYFQLDAKAGPFATAKDFNDRVQFWALNWMPLQERPFDPYRSLLLDTNCICFAHADLHLDNILISGEPGSRSIAAIIDWEMSGWYPEYWEYCKMMLGAGCHAFEEEGWLTEVLKPYDLEYDAFVNYWQCRGIP